MPVSPFDTLVVPIGGGLNLVDSPEALGPGEAVALDRWRFTGVGRLTTGRAARQVLSLPGEDVIGVFAFPHGSDAAAGKQTGGVVVTYYDSDGSGKKDAVRIRAVDGAGINPGPARPLPDWTVIQNRPRVMGAVLRECLFLIDPDRSRPLVVYDPNEVLGAGAGVKVFRPTFSFVGGPYLPLKVRCIAEYHNHLFVAGYLQETPTSDQNRPEVVRFSYLGLENDFQGAGDAGEGGAPGSANLFDRDDWIPVAPRGTPVIQFAKAAGRLLVFTPHNVYVLWGYDRTSFQRDLLDDERGLYGAFAVTEVGDVAYWMSRLGFVRFAGGRVEDIGRRVLPRIAEVNPDSVIAVHDEGEHVVTWYYRRTSDGSGGANRAISYDYRADQWVDVPLGIEVFCGGTIRPQNAPGPAAPPANLLHAYITTRTARAMWVNGDTAPETKTRVYRAPDNGGSPGQYVLVATVDSGVNYYTYSGLEPSTPYWTKIEHERNGMVSAAIEARFVTAAPATISPPSNLAAADSPVWDAKLLRYRPSVHLSWQLLEANRYVEIERKTGAGGTWQLVHDTALGETDWRDDNVTAGVTYFYRARARDEEQNYSAYSVEVQVTPTQPTAEVVRRIASFAAPTRAYLGQFTGTATSPGSQVPAVNDTYTVRYAVTVQPFPPGTHWQADIFVEAYANSVVVGAAWTRLSGWGTDQVTQELVFTVFRQFTNGLPVNWSLKFSQFNYQVDDTAVPVDAYVTGIRVEWDQATG